MITENLQTLKIHKLTKAQYERELAAGNIDENAIYLTPDEEVDLTPYATVEQLNTKADKSHTHTIANVTNLQSSLDAKVPTSRTINGKALTANITLSASDVGAAASSHTHDDIYYTETEIDEKFSGITSGTTVVKEAEHATSADSAEEATHATSADTAASATSATKATQDGNGKVIADTYETKTDSEAKLAEAKEYVDGLFEGAMNAVSADFKTVNEEIDALQTNSHTHSNKTVLDGITSAKVTAWDAAEQNAKTYADGVGVSVKNDLLNGAGAAYDTLKELGDLIVDNADAIEALETIASGKADATHSHAISDVSGLQSALDGKAAASHGTHVSFDSTNKPKMDGTAAFGTSTKVARADHVHPTDTSRASKTEFDTHATDTTKHITSTERTNWGAAYTHSTSAHAPSDAEKNQNAFSNVKVGTTTVAADTATDTIEFVGSNVTITPDATNDKITFAVANGSTSTAGILKLTNSTSSTSTTTAATPSSVKSAYDLANQAKTAAATAQSTADGKADASHTHAVANITDLTATATELNYMAGVTSGVQAQLDGKAASGHSHSDATTSASGFMTAAMVTKLNGIATGANKITVDSALSSTSTNPVQNKAVNNAITTATSAITANTNSISTHTNQISALQTAVSEIQEITSEEITALFA